MEIILVIVVSYLLGSIPSAFLAGKIKGVDIRTVGSGNVGATNALRTFGKKVGYAVFAADFLKGALAVFLAGAPFVWLAVHLVGSHCGEGEPYGLFCARVGIYYLGLTPWNWILFPQIVAAVSVMLGHIYPVWLKFKGGKGVATAAGVLCVLSWPVFVVAIVVWLVVFYTTRYVSLASIALAASLPVTAAVLAWWGHCPRLLVVFVSLIAVLAVWKHRSNIKRLLDGTESRFEKTKS